MTEQQSIPKWLLNEGYTDIRLIGDNKYIAINRYLFTEAIIRGDLNDTWFFEDRWCYHNYRDAKEALDKWDGIGDPEGWHRHPKSGRRRDEDGKEYVRF